LKLLSRSGPDDASPVQHLRRAVYSHIVRHKTPADLDFWRLPFDIWRLLGIQGAIAAARTP